MKRTVSNLTTGETTYTEMTEVEVAELEASHKAGLEELNERYGPLYKLRQERDRLLHTTDWWNLRDTTDITQEQKDYRQALRDLPVTADITKWGTEEWVWPIKPGA